MAGETLQLLMWWDKLCWLLALLAPCPVAPCPVAPRPVAPGPVAPSPQQEVALPPPLQRQNANFCQSKKSYKLYISPLVCVCSMQRLCKGFEQG